MPPRLSRLMTVLLCLFFTLPSIVSAQEGLREREDRWNEAAERAEEAILNGAASPAALEILREELAAQRAESFELMGAGSITVESLEAQLEALGPAPKKDESEPASRATRRAELTNALSEAEAPILAARQAFSRAEVLIGGVDRLIRQALRAEMFALSPSPFIPANWLPALSHAGEYIARIHGEIVTMLRNPGQELLLRERAPAAVSMITGALFILGLVQPALIRRLENRARDPRQARRNSGIVGALALRLALTAIAAALLSLALQTLDFVPPSARTAVNALPKLVYVAVAPYWLGHLIFAPSMPEGRLLQMDDAFARRASRYCTALGIVVVFEAINQLVEIDYTFTAATRSIWAAIVVLAGSYCLWQLARILVQAGRDDPANPSDEHDGGVLLIGRLIQLVTGAAIASVAVGYVEIAREAMDPTIMSLGLAGVAVTVHKVLVYLLLWLLGGNGYRETAAQSLLPVGVGILVTFLLLPVLALLWGARTADLTDALTLLNEGVEIGGRRISVTTAVMLLAVFASGIFVTRWLQRFLGRTVLPRTRLDSGGRNAVVTGSGYVGLILSALVAVSVAGLDLSNLAIVAGALSVGIGFGLQAVVSNFVSGIILLAERPIREGDWIEVSGHSGIVQKISVRSTRIETFDRHDVIVPNADLITGAVKNMTLSSTIGRIIIPVSVSHGSDLELVASILRQAAEQHPRVERQPAPAVPLVGLGESSMDFELRCFIDDVSAGLSVKSDLLHNIHAAFARAGIDIPHPHRDVLVRNVDEIAKAFLGNLPPAPEPRDTPAPPV